MKDEILKLRGEGKSYSQIQKELGCSSSTISYHCGQGQKQKNYIRSIRNYASRKAGEKKTRKWLQKLAWRYKRLVGCKDCGNKDPRVLDYDHVKGEKQYNVADLWKWSYSVKTLKDEIRKCEVRCSNCHRIKTYGDIPL